VAPNTKALIYFFSPAFVRAFLQRIEASPLGSRLARGMFWSLAGSLISRGLGLVSAILVGRLLGKEAFGELGIIQSTVGTFGTLAGFGMGLTANKHIAELKRIDPARAGRILGLANASAWFSSGLMALALVVSAPWLATKTLAAPHLASLLQVGGLLLFLSGINGAQTGALAGFEAFKAIARINLISGVLTCPLMVAGAWNWGVAGAVWGLIGSHLANCLLCFAAIRVETARFQIRYAFSGWRGEWNLFFGFSLPAILIEVLNGVVAWGASAVLVNQPGGYAEMGIYNAAFRVTQIPNAVLGMLVAPIIPVLSESFRTSDHHSHRRTLRLFLLMSTLAIVPVSLLQAAAPELTLLPFGPEYQRRPLIVSWLMFYAVLVSLGSCVGYVLVTAGRVWLTWLISFEFAACQALFALLLVPRYGAEGYAASLALACTASGIPGVVILYRSYPDTMRYARWGTLALASLLLFALCILGSILPSFPWTVGLGIVASFSFVALVFCSSRQQSSRPNKRRL
jgi:O-antigen/teichoic acid export membrane protein